MVEVCVPPEQTPGTYDGAVRVIAAGRGIRVPFTVEVLDFILPRTSTASTTFAIPYAEVVGTEPRRDYRHCTERLYHLQLSRRAVPTDLPIPPDVAPAEWVRLAQWCLRDDRITSYRIPFRVEEPAWTRLLVGGLREHGLLDRAFFLVDESEDADAETRHERLRVTCERLDLIAPDVPRLVTAEPVPALTGCTHTWAPTPDRFDPETARQRRAAGDRVCWRGGRAPGSTFLPDDDPTGVRLLPWMQQAYGVEGHVYRVGVRRRAARLAGTSFTVAGAAVTDVERTASYARGRHRLELAPVGTRSRLRAGVPTGATWTGTCCSSDEFLRVAGSVRA